MAAGLMRHLSNGRVDVYSAGSEPAESLNSMAAAAMAERGIDIGGETPKVWDDAMVRGADVVVTMGCGDTCPFFPGKRYEDWQIEDPSGKSLEQDRVRGLLEELDPPVI
jgi:arsenate reductase